MRRANNDGGAVLDGSLSGQQSMRYALVLALAACTAQTDAAPTYTLDDLADAGYEAAADAWAAAFGTVPAHCRTAWLDISVGEWTEADLEAGCEHMAPSGYVLRGCLRGDTILVEAGDESIQACTFAHEWVHLLARECDGDPDSDHLRAELWDPATGVEADAIRRVTL